MPRQRQSITTHSNWHARHYAASFAFVSICCGSTWGESTPDVASTVRSIEQSEKQLRVIYVEGTVQRYSGSDEPPTHWKQDAVGSSGRVWLNGKIGGPFKVVIDKEVSEWVAGPKGQPPYYEEKSQAQSDGVKTTVLKQAVGSLGNTTDPRQAMVSSSRSAGRDSIQYTWGSGSAFTAQYWGETSREKNQTLSTYINGILVALKQLRQSGHTEVIEDVAFDTVGNTKCLRLSLGYKGVSKDIWWFDLERGFSLIKYEKTMGERHVSSTRLVTELVSPSPGLWYPSEGTYDVYVYTPKGTDAEVSKAIRYAYKATKVSANDESLQRQIADPLILPVGTEVTDDSEKRVYRVAPADDKSAQEIEQALTEAFQATTRPSTQSSDRSNQ